MHANDQRFVDSFDTVVLAQATFGVFMYIQDLSGNQLVAVGCRFQAVL